MGISAIILFISSPVFYDNIFCIQKYVYTQGGLAAMLKKIMGWTLKIIVGVFAFYLFVGFVVIPAGLSWAIKDQGTKILQHPVKVRSVSFNPFFLRLGINGLEVLGSDQQLMAGFDKLDVDVSFISLFKKEYRVESIALDGLKVNTVLMPDGKINLMSLVPATPEAVPATTPEAVPATEAKAPAPLPLVFVDLITLQHGNVHFLDRTLQPNFASALSDIDVRITDISTKSDAQSRLVFQGKLGGKGTVSTELVIRPFTQPLELETTFSLDDFALDVLTPYVGKYTGRALKDGKFELKMDYRISDNKLTAAHKVLIQRFEFGQKVESKDALPLPFGLAVALLEDPQGRIKISLPVSGDMSKPDFHYWSLVGQVVRNFFMGLVTKPFAFLASALGADSGTDELGFVKFLPGKADLSDAEKEKIKTLLGALKDRPKLRLEVNGGYDPKADWTAIKTDSLETSYKELRAKSSRTDSWIYQMLYQRAFGIRDLWALTSKYKVKEGAYNEEALVAELKRQLIENAPADTAAMQALANARATAVYDLIAATGFDAGRLSLGINREEQASMGFVPLEFTLTVFGEEAVQ
jgi:outer membrane protein OmpA-like peptidoglycan-associated protein